MSRPAISIVLPIYIPSLEHKKMTDTNLHIAKSKTNIDCEWVIVETCSDYYLNEADVYINEKKKTTPTVSLNRAFSCCSGEYVVFIANDVTVCDGWVEKMIECFDMPSCGIASLGNNEHNDPIENIIVEDFYYTVSMMRKEDAWYDTKLQKIFQDTDLAFRLHLQGKKFYKNLAGNVYHKPHSTTGKFGGDIEEYEISREYFRNKYLQHAESEIYKRFAGIR